MASRIAARTSTPPPATRPRVSAPRVSAPRVSTSRASAPREPSSALPARLLETPLRELSEAELLELALGLSTTSVTARPGRLSASDLPFLARYGPAELVEELNIALPDAVRLGAALELGVRAERARHPLKLGTPMTAELVARWARPLVSLDHEEVWVLCLDGRSALRCARKVGQGGIHGCALLARDVLVPIVREAASAFVLVHNHPSGDPAPSREDREMTRALGAMAELLGIPLLDHVIVARSGHSSFLELGYLPAS